MKFCKSHCDILTLIGSLIIASITRIAIPFSMVFQNGKVIFNAADAYYQLRFADLISAHFPQTNFYDPYLNTQMGGTPLFNLLLAWLGRLFGNLDVVAAYLPAILGILTLIPVFVITKSIFNNKWITSLAVFFTAILPGLFYNRTQLGAADYHCLEIFLLTMIMMCIVLAIKVKIFGMKFTYGLFVVGLFLLYYWTWQGSVVTLFILAVFAYVWLALREAKRHPNIKYNAILQGLIISVVVILIVLFYFEKLEPITSWVRYGVGMFTWHFSSSTAEEWPLFFQGFSSVSGNMPDLQTVWGYFGFLFFFALVGLGMLIYRVQKHKQTPEILLLVWSVVMLLLTLAMRRWAYYLAVNVAILSAYSCYVIGKALIIKRAIVAK